MPIYLYFMSKVMSDDMAEVTTNVPKIVFIVPYRNRYQHKFFFSNYLTSILELSDTTAYEIYFSHQCDSRSFNRGAVKNIGFLAIKQKYPNDYKDITFVFNDIDTIPFSNIFIYQTTHGIVKHFYGFNYALGGIVSITGSDFEATNGYPNFWGWGMEDTVLQQRCENIGLHINRDQFFPIGSPEILHLFDGVSRLINRKDPIRANNDNGQDGIRTIAYLLYTIDSESINPLDNIHTVESDKTFIINIEQFMTGTNYETNDFYKYDLRENPNQVMNAPRQNINESAINKMNNNDWTNIPFFPSSEKKNELIRQYGKEHAEQIIKYSYANSVDPNTPVMPPNLRQQQQPQRPQQQQQQQRPQQQQQQQQQRPQQMQQQQEQMQAQQYNQLMQQFNSKSRIIPQNINKFSSAYSRIIAAKPKANKSANIKMGGIY